MDPREGQGVYETGRSVLRVEEGDDNLLRVLVEDVTTSDQHKYEADAVIAADGANSTVRKQLHPNIRREEPGYVLWRGTVPTKGLSKEILDKLDGKTTMCPMPYSYTIM
jgi:2-polyprenyl-6-methoxyphenol hydroxylase-like FAD-dependent oxidoreductase